MSVGFIRDKLEIKFLILYVAAGVAEPMPLSDVQALTMIDDGMTSDPEQFVTEIQIPVGMRQEKGEEEGKKKKLEKSAK